MGAQFINGKDNPIYKIAEKLNVVESILPDTAQFSRADFLFGNQTIDWLDLSCVLLGKQQFQVRY